MAAVVAATNGQSSIIGSAAGEYTFADRYGYVAVTNTGSDPIYVTADGSTPETSGAGTAIVVAPNETRVIANGLPLWYQSLNVIPAGVNQFGAGATTSTAVHPGMVQSQRALNGQMANPGTILNVAETGTPTTTLFSLEGTG